MSSPRIAVVGPGGVGCFFAAHLAAAGHEVVACARRPFDRYLVESDEAPVAAPATVVVDPEQLDGDPFDWVLVAVKAHQSAGAAPWFDRVCGTGTVVVALQNGIEAVERLAPFVAGAPVLDSVVYCGAELIEPGRVRHTSNSRLIVPDVAESHRLAELYRGTPVTIDISADHRRSAWVKLGINVVANGLSALTGQPMAVLAEAEIAEVAAALLTEVLTVGRAEGVELELDGVEQTIALLAAVPSGRTSMLHDVEAGRPTEHDALHGAVIRAGRRHGIPTPYTDTIHALLAALTPTDPARTRGCR